MISSSPNRRGCPVRAYSLAELLVVMLILTLISSFFIPNLLDAIHKAKQKRTLSDIKQVGDSMMSWYIDQVGATSPGRTIDVDQFTPIDYEDLEDLLVPTYSVNLPREDAWGHAYDYYFDSASVDGTFVDILGIRSRGRDGVADGSVYAAGPFVSTDYTHDIVWVDGSFVQFPGTAIDQN